MGESNRIDTIDIDKFCQKRCSILCFLDAHQVSCGTRRVCPDFELQWTTFIADMSTVHAAAARFLAMTRNNERSRENLKPKANVLRERKTGSAWGLFTMCETFELRPPVP